MTTYDVAFVGTGADPANPDASGFAMAYRHAEAYEELPNCELSACADVVPENAEAFAAEHGIDDDRIYESHGAMLDQETPDIVSICVPPAHHADIAIDCARGGVDAIHCEKPMDLTWGGSRAMAREAWRHDVQLTFNHQRRFGRPFRRAKELLEAGEIGDLQRVEFAADNVFDYGSHSIDLCNYFTDERSAEWVLANVDYREENVVFGAHNENQAIVQWEYENGVHGLGATGTGAGMVSAHNRLVGSAGEIEIAPGFGAADDGDYPELRIRRGTDEWEAIDTDGEHAHGPDYIERAIADVVESLDTGADSELRAKNALNATEITFAAWESARRRGRVDLPLEIEDNPLEAMVESGALQPESTEE